MFQFYIYLPYFVTKLLVNSHHNTGFSKTNPDYCEDDADVHNSYSTAGSDTFCKVKGLYVTDTNSHQFTSLDPLFAPLRLQNAPVFTEAEAFPIN